MTTKPANNRPILVTGAGGAIGGIGRNVTMSLLAKGYQVRALVRKDDERADELRRLGMYEFVKLHVADFTRNAAR